MYSKHRMVGLTGSGFLLAMLVNSCIPRSISNSGIGGATRNGSLSSISMNLPKKEQMTSSDGAYSVNGVRLVITPTSSNCQNPTNLEQVMPTGSSNSLSQKVAKGCSYEVSVYLGILNASSTGLEKLIYTPPTPAQITEAMTKDDKISVRISLAITEEGRQLGFPESISSGSTPTPSPTPPQPSPAPPSLQQLPNELNIQLVQGANGSRNLSEIFTKKYLIIDFSQLGCGPCISLATSIEQDRAFKSFIDNSSKCTFLTVLPAGQSQSWINKFGPTSWGASHTFEYAEGVTKFGRLFKDSQGTSYQLEGTPSVILVDRSGTFQVKSTGDLQRSLSTECQN